MNLIELSAAEFELFCGLIYRVAGIKIPPTKRVMVSNRLRRRLRATGLATFSEYFTFLTSASGKSEMPRFLDEITTNETYFYRDMQHFEWLSQEFIPEIVEAARLHRRPKRLRIWSAAASSGEELYSAALKVAAARPRLAGWETRLLGTDLSGAVLASARAGVYDDRAVRLVPPEERNTYFDHDPENQRWTVKPEIRAMAKWKIHNLLQPAPESPFDCIFIKNVLIYFDAASKQAVVKHLVNALAQGAYLVVGPTEGIASMLGSLQKLSAWLYRRND